MIPVLILAGIDVVLGCCAIVLLAERNVYRQAANEAREGWSDLIGWLEWQAREGKAIRCARARHARQCQIDQQRQRKAETTAQLQREVGR